MTPAILAAAAVALNPAAPALTPADARAATPASLAAALLAPGHPAVVEAEVGPEIINGPPPPPGEPIATDIRLFFAATRAGPADFCEKQVATVTLEPVTGPRRALPPARPRSVTVRSLYRWRPAGGACEARRGAFFAANPRADEDNFHAILALAELRRGRTRVPISMDDRWARESAEYLREHPEDADGQEPPRPITDGRQALAAFPLDQISYVGSSDTAYSNLLSGSDLTAPDGRRLRGATLFAGGLWTAAMVLDGDRIVRVKLERAIPPPF